MNNKLKILIVDNHPLFLNSISAILSGPEYEIRTAEGGLQAIDILDTFTPQIFFIDLIMPSINGEKLTKYIRAQDNFINSFIVILSGIAKESDRISIPEGADAFIAKGPAKLMAKHILDCIDRYRNKKRDIHFENLLGLNEIVPRHITKELLFSLRHLEVLLDNMQEGVVEISMDNRIVFINPAAVKILGSSEMQLLSKNFFSIFSDEDKQRIDNMLIDFDSDIQVKDFQTTINNYFVQINILRVIEGNEQSKIILLNDVTKFKEKEKKIKKTLEEKELLIKEIHHRVKNTLNVISGLISIQSSMIEDELIKNMLLEIQPRLQSISLVHDKLYNTEDLTHVSLNTYLEELATLLIDMMSNDNFPINLEVDIPDLKLNTDKIVALGLICTELITNAVKYGFYKENPEKNTLKISLTENETYELVVSNNGYKFPDHVNLHNSKKLGFQVINLLVEQIEGKIKLESGLETTFTISFS
ncbi:MAG: response regulator [Spirochaetaceae bacterium]|jgi:PAS domain S-box-containing protein|nr:response regulator [Spirochaetaceae bacterium]